MWYLIREIVWFLALTAMLWGAVGWWLRSISHRATLQDMESEFASKIQSLRHSRDSYRDQLEQVQVGAEHAGAQLSEQQRAQITAHIRKLEKDASDSRGQVDAMSAKLNAVASNAQARENEYKVLRQRLDNATKAIGERDAHIARLSQAANDTQSETQGATPGDARSRSLGTVADKSAAQAQQIAHYQAVVAKLKARIETLSEQSNQPLAATEHSKLLNVIQAQKKTIASLTDKVARLQEHDAAADTAELEEKLQQQAAATAAREKELTRLNNERLALVATVEKLEADLARQKASSATPAAAPGPTETKLRQALAQQQQHSAALTEELNQVREEHEMLSANAHRQQDSIDALHRRLHAAPDDDVAGMRARLQTQDETIARLKQEIKQLGAARQVVRKPAELPVERSGDLFERTPAVILDAPDGVSDDLKKIHGIGPVLENKLNELGVYHFRQIASFDDDDILWLAAQMDSFPNRIKRDDWVAQAALLEAERRASDAS